MHASFGSRWRNGFRRPALGLHAVAGSLIGSSERPLYCLRGLGRRCRARRAAGPRRAVGRLPWDVHCLISASQSNPRRAGLPLRALGSPRKVAIGPAACFADCVRDSGRPRRTRRGSTSGDDELCESTSERFKRLIPPVRRPGRILAAERLDHVKNWASSCCNLRQSDRAKLVDATVKSLDFGAATRDMEIKMKFRLGCELAYKVLNETVFIFNVSVAILQRHKNLVDELNFNPNLPRRFYAVPDLRNRYVQVVAPVGDLSLSYSCGSRPRRLPGRSSDGPRNGRSRSSARHPSLPPAEPVRPVGQAGEFRYARVRRRAQGASRGSARFAHGSTRISNIAAAAATPRRRRARF